VTFTVVIPALDEARGLPATIGSVWRAAAGRAVELLVVDGGSRDGTRRIAGALGASVCSATGGRGGQLAEGARRASGDTVLMLHADTWLPDDAFAAVERTLRDPEVVGGGFRKSFRDGPASVRRGSRWRSVMFFVLTGIVLGDQALFVRRAALERVGGVPVQPLLEDVELSRRLGTVGRLALADAEVSTSARRFARRGPLRTWLLMGGVLAGHWLGVPPRILDRWYRGAA